MKTIDAVKMINAVVRKIGTSICCTFDNEDFSMIAEEEFNLLPPEVLAAVERDHMYEGPIPASIYWAELLLRGG